MINNVEITGKLYGIDFSTAIIEVLQNKNENEKLIYEVMDARHLTYNNNSFDLVIDKGTIDAMLCSDNWNENVELILNEMCRVLKNEGQIMIVSHLHFESNEFQEIMNEILVPILGNYTIDRMWNIDVHCTESTNNNKEGDEEEDQDQDEEDNEEDNEDNEVNNGASVYIISSRNRRVTRSSTLGKSLPVQIKVMTYESENC